MLKNVMSNYLLLQNRYKTFFVIQPGTSWKRGECDRCTCFNNAVQCKPVQCPAIECDEEAGMIPASVAGACCQQCIPTTTFPTEAPTSASSTSTPVVCDESMILCELLPRRIVASFVS